MFDAEPLIDAHGLVFSCHEVAENPFMPQDSDDLRHWFCTVSGGAVPGFEFYVSLGDDAGGAEPSPSLAISLVMEDVRSFRACEGYADFAKMIGLDETDPSGRVAWDEIERLAPMAEALADIGQKPTMNPS